MEKDITQKTKGVSLVTKKSKAGGEYTVIRITFASGYCLDNFMTADQQYILNNLK